VPTPNVSTWQRLVTFSFGYLRGFSRGIAAKQNAMRIFCGNVLLVIIYQQVGALLVARYFARQMPVNCELRMPKSRISPLEIQLRKERERGQAGVQAQACEFKLLDPGKLRLTTSSTSERFCQPNCRSSYLLTIWFRLTRNTRKELRRPVRCERKVPDIVVSCVKK
jgi:hypothetical protein